MQRKNANIELLRMISMFFIILHHAVLYSDVLSNSEVSLNKYIAAIVYIGGKYGANVFLAITAYFLIDKPFQVKRLFNVWKTTFFYGILFYAGNMVMGFRQYTIKDIGETLLPISYKSYWFVTTYVGLIFLSPFLNALIHKLDKMEYTLLLIIVASMVAIPVTFLPGAHPFADESHLFLSVFIYLVVGYYKKGFGENIMKKKFLGGVAFGGFLWMVICSIIIIRINNPMLNSHITYWMVSA